MNKLCQFYVVPLLLTLLAGCASAPLDYPKEESFALADTSHTQ